MLAREAGSTSGKWRTSTVEVARGPMLAVTEPGVHTITAMVATQLLKTSLLENTLGYFAHLDPSPMLLVQPKEDAAEQFSKERITPMVRSTPVLREIIGSAKTRRADETLLYKSFPGGFLALAGAGSPDNLARRPVRVVMYDEVDKYPITREGDPIALGDERMATFANWLSVRVCSPTVSDESRIDASYQDSDQRKASVACPHCEHRQFLSFDHIRWDKAEDGTHKPETARVYCDGCGVGWSEGERLRALATIRWHQTRPFTCCGERSVPLDAYEAAAKRGAGAEAVWDWWESDRHAVYRARCPHCSGWPVPNEHAGFQAGKEFSPWPKDAPPKFAAKWLAAKDDENLRQVWVNTQRGLPYRLTAGREVKLDALLTRRETWSAKVPEGVALLTAGIDVQDSRLECEIVGWGRDEESWSIDYQQFDGDPGDPEVWERLDAHLRERWRRADGREFAVEAACVDSGGHHTQAVYSFSKARLGRRIWAIKGASERNGQRSPVWPAKRPTNKGKVGFRPIVIGVNAAKDAIADRLARSGHGPGYMHFPDDRDLGYFQQLTAERQSVKTISGRKFRIWEPISGRANEALDCRVYAYAALCGLQFMGVRLNRLAAEIAPMPVDEPDDVPTAAPSNTPRFVPRAAVRGRTIRSGFMARA